MLDNSFTKKIELPKAFSKIIDSINSFHLETIPSQNKIPDFRDKAADGMYYTLELATKNFYKLLLYHNPNKYQDSIHKNVNEILTFFQRNLDAFVLN